MLLALSVVLIFVLLFTLPFWFPLFLLLIVGIFSTLYFLINQITGQTLILHDDSGDPYGYMHWFIFHRLYK